MERYKHIFDLATPPKDPPQKTKRLRDDPPVDDQPGDDSLIDIIKWSMQNYYGLLPENNEAMLDRYSPLAWADPRCFKHGYEKVEATTCPPRMDV